MCTAKERVLGALKGMRMTSFGGGNAGEDKCTKWASMFDLKGNNNEITLSNCCDII